MEKTKKGAEKMRRKTRARKEIQEREREKDEKVMFQRIREEKDKR